MSDSQRRPTPSSRPDPPASNGGEPSSPATLRAGPQPSVAGDTGPVPRDFGPPPPSSVAVLYGDVSLPEVHGTVRVSGTTFWRRLLKFTGPAFMVSVGYMDPGNWATDLAGGARFGYQLIWVILLSNLIAILLQTLSARLGLVTGTDLAQACRDHYPRPVVWVSWILCEIAIAACDLAEVLGSAIGLHLLLGIPLLWGVVITAFDVMLLLLLQAYGIRKMEAVILSLVATIGACFAVEMFLSNPPLGAVIGGLAPRPLSGGALYVAIGIIGATVMPHNLYLHSALVQSRAVDRTRAGLREAVKFNLIDCFIALNGAFLVNVAILVLAAAAFWKTGHSDVATLESAHSLLNPILGSRIAPIAFAIALLAAGQSSTITGTLAGQIVMEGFVRIRLRPWLRRFLTRSMAIVPAVLVIGWSGEGGVDPLLILSQVVLSLQLSFAIVPLIHFTSDRRKMGDFATPTWGALLAWLAAAIIISLNVKLVFETLADGLHSGNWAAQFLLLPGVCLLLPLLVYMILEPIWGQLRARMAPPLGTPALPPQDTTLQRQYRRIALALEAGPRDQEILSGVIPLVRAAGAELVLIHTLETAAAHLLGENVRDEEAIRVSDYLERTAAALREAGVACTVRLGAGGPDRELARIASEEGADLIVTGSHGHRFFGDIFHGSTVTELRHRTSIPVLSLRTP
jgi:manganese transport protein